MVPFLLAMGGDWLQGAYVYALYQNYGYSQQQIALLFVVGFGSAMIFGTFVGSLADRLGRKKMALVFVVTYIFSCVSKHFKNFGSLMVGRLLGGIATALLFSVFESWVVCENARRNFPSETLSVIFSQAHFCNAIVAIIAGLAAQAVSDVFPLTGGPVLFYGGDIAPFDLAMLVLVVAGLTIAKFWNENYSIQTRQESWRANVAKALSLMGQQKQLLVVGLVQSLFEGSMYCFVFMWTPMLSEAFSNPPIGLIFATFMVACMIGSQGFGLQVRLRPSIKPRHVLPVVFALSSVSFACIAVGIGGTIGMYVSYMVFEICVGIYFPAIALLKSEIVPEAYRATIYNLFRVPLNIIVLAMLLTGLSPRDTFTAGAVLLCVAFLLQSCASTCSGESKSIVRKQEPRQLADYDDFSDDYDAL